jgi:hypothetical protein
MHRWEVGVSRRAEGKQGRAFIGDMTEEKSVELASKLASEGFIFVVSFNTLPSTAGSSQTMVVSTPS